MNAVRMAAMALLASGWMILCSPTAAAQSPAGGTAAPLPDSGCAQKLVVVTVWPLADMPDALVTGYQAELQHLLHNLGICPRFADLSEATSRSFAGRIVVLRMLQSDAALSQREALHLLPRAALAWTHASGQDVTPFGAVDMAALRAFLGMTDTHASEFATREGIAVARLAAHEIYHMLTRTKTHSTRGLMKAGLTRDELLAPRAPSWTSDNRQQAQAQLPTSRPMSMAALSGARSQDGRSQRGAIEGRK
ncbi:MAG: hypothetical protein MUF01_07345 [Bryobacterales bacterium]|jgi:hypothetical protein|nr:hypothetical protein [Bryobacterales bacterium]